MFGNNNRGTGYWNSSTQPNNNLQGSFNALGSTVQTTQPVNSTFGGFGSGNNMAGTGFMAQNSTPAFGVAQNTTVFGQAAQQPASTGFGGVGTTGGLFDQNKQGFLGTTGGVFGQTNQSGGVFGSTLNTGVGNTFGSSMNTGTSMFGNTTATGGMWSGGSGTTFGSQIQGTEVATLKHFDGANITHLAFEKPDTCQEEYRWEYYKKANPQLGVGGAQQGTAPTTTGGLFSSTQPSTTSGGLFNTTQPATGSSFFGSTQTAQTTGSLFGSSQPATTTGSIFGNTQPAATTAPLFGSSQPTTTGGIFGSTTTGTTGGGMFGGTSTTAAPTGSLFGSTQTTAPTGGLFSSNQPAAGSSSFFGGTQRTTGLFGSTQPATSGTTNILGGTQPSTSTGLFGSTSTAGTATTGGTGMFGSTTGTTPSTNLFSSSNTSAFGGANKSLFGTSTTTPGATGAGTSGTGLFGSTNLFGSTTTPGTGTTGTTGLFGTTTTGTTGTGLFGSSTSTTGTSLFGNTATGATTGTGTSSGLFGASSGTGTTGLFGNTRTPGTPGSLFSFGSPSAGTQLPQGGAMRLGPLTFSWNVNTPSPGLRSFWSNEAELPPEAREYLAKMANMQNNATQAIGAPTTQQQGATQDHTQSGTGIAGLEDMQDRFGLRQVLKDLGVQIPRYNVNQDTKDEYLKYAEGELATRSKTRLSSEAKLERDLCGTFTKISKSGLDSRIRTKNDDLDEVTSETFLSLHNGGAKELEALRHQARGGHLRKPQPAASSPVDELPYLPPNRSPSVFDKPNHQADLLKSTYEPNDAEAGMCNRTLGDLYNTRSESGESSSSLQNKPGEESDPAYDGDVIASSSSDSSKCQIFKLADDAPGHPPLLTKEGYTTRPTMSSLRQMSDKQLANVMDFQILREGYGDILWPGYTDVRQLNLDKIVDIGNRRVTLYGSSSHVHPVGEGLNKNAIVTLYNCTPQGYSDGKSISETVEQLEKLKDHTASLGCKFRSANLKTGQWVFEAPHFVKSTGGDLSERQTMSFVG